MGSIKKLDQNIAVITSTYVINDRMPILYVSNDNDEEGGGIWQFHCGNEDFDMEIMLLVSLSTILNLDEDLGDLDLVVGEEALRDNKKSTWKIRRQ